MNSEETQIENDKNKKRRIKSLISIGIIFILLALWDFPINREPSTKEEKIQRALRRLQGDESVTRYSGISTLVQLRANEYVSNIAKLLEDKDELVRAKAVSALGELGAKKYANNIAKLLKDENKLVRCCSVSALYALQAKEYADNIKPLLNDKDEAVKLGAASVLLWWGDVKDAEKILRQKQ